MEVFIWLRNILFVNKQLSMDKTFNYRPLMYFCLS